MYEDCILLKPKVYAPGHLDHTLAVEFMDAPGQKAFSWISFNCRADKTTSEFLARHPRWRHDPTPFVLGVIQQIVWRIKVIDIPMRTRYHKEAGIRDESTGGETRITIRGEIVDEKKLQHWLLPIVNFSHTHVQDQLKLFYGQNPHLAPGRTTLESLMNEQHFKVAQKSVAESELRTRRRADFSTVENGVTAFIDESGDPGFADLMSEYTLSAIIVDDDKLDLFREAVREVPEKVWGRNFPLEVHYNKVPASKKESVRCEFADAISKFGVEIRCFSSLKLNYLRYLMRCHAEARFGEEEPIDFSLQEYIDDPSSNIQYGFISLILEEAVSHICIEHLTQGRSARFCHDRKRSSWMNRALNSGFELALENVSSFSSSFYGKDLSFPSELTTPNSRDEPLLWVSDWVSNEVGKWSKGIDLSQELSNLGDRFLVIGYDDDGIKRGTRTLGGTSDFEFGEIPRHIRNLARDRPANA